LGVCKYFESTLVEEGNDETKAISVKISLEEIEVRAICAYGPQEAATKKSFGSSWSQKQIMQSWKVMD
jgi:hypothetical protein